MRAGGEHLFHFAFANIYTIFPVEHFFLKIKLSSYHSNFPSAQFHISILWSQLLSFAYWVSDSLPEFTIGEPCCPHALLHGHTEYLHEKYDLAAWCTNCVPLDECLCYYLKAPSGEIWVSVRTVCRPGCWLSPAPVSPLLKCSFGRLLNCSVTPARPHCHGITLQHRIYSHICIAKFFPFWFFLIYTPFSFSIISNAFLVHLNCLL